MGLDRFDIRVPHVAAHDLHAAPAPAAEPAEEARDRVAGAALTRPHEAVPLEVVDEREIALAFGAAHLVDPEHVQGPPAAQLRPRATASRMIAATVFQSRPKCAATARARAVVTRAHWAAHGT